MGKPGGAIVHWRIRNVSYCEVTTLMAGQKHQRLPGASASDPRS